VPRLLFALTLAAALVLQASILPELPLSQVRPNLLLVLILLWTIARGPREGALWAFGVGLAVDLVTLAPLGAHALALLSAVLVGDTSRTSRFRLGLLLPMVAVLGATVVHDLVLLLVERASLGLVLSLAPFSLLAGLLNLVCTPLLYLWTTWLHRWLLDVETTAGRPTRSQPASRGPRR
jgi:rod shape-determining protein MreD